MKRDDKEQIAAELKEYADALVTMEKQFAKYTDKQGLSFT